MKQEENKHIGSKFSEYYIETLQEEVERLSKENEQLKQWRSQDQSSIEKKDHEITQLKVKLEKAKEALRFYGDAEHWIKREPDSWNKVSPREHNDSEIIKNYAHPKTDWVGSVVVGGKRARAALREIEKMD